MDQGSSYNFEVYTEKSREYSGSKFKDFLNRTPAVQQLRERMYKCTT
jgi:hypothetical protein